MSIIVLFVETPRKFITAILNLGANVFPSPTPIISENFE
jgi:hypothetical protein